MKYFRILLVGGLILTGFCTDVVFGQAFNSFNGRNHPEIKWMEAETQHFRFIYAKTLEKFIPEAAAIAESTYTSLSKARKVEFDRKIKVYFSDEDEIVNGAAVPINGSYTFIWLGLNNQSQAFSSDKKWIRKVLAHELTHLFHFEAVKGTGGLWSYIFGDVGDRDFTEGFAQYSTETWDALRGDIYLRSAVFDDKMDPLDGTSLRYGGLIYSEGFSKLLFISDQYGDSTITKMLSYRDTLAFGFKSPDVYKGFEKATGEAWDSFENRWMKHINVYYNTLASQMARTDSLKKAGKEIPLFGNQIVLGAAISPDGEHLAASLIKSTQEPYSQIAFFKIDSTGYKLLNRKIIGSNNGDLSWSVNGEKIYYSKLVRDKKGSLVNDLYVMDFKTKNETRLSISKRLLSPVALNNETLWLIQNQNGTGNIVSFDLKTHSIENITHYSGDNQLANLTINKQKNTVAYSLFDENGGRYLVVRDIKTGKETKLTKAENDDRQPKLSDDGKTMAFVSLRDHVPNVFKIDIESAEETRVTNVFTGAELLDWDEDSHSFLVKSSESKVYERLFSVPDSLVDYNPVPKVPASYTSWTIASPDITIGGGIKPNPDLILTNKEHRAFTNIGHLMSFALPYYEKNATKKDYGIQGFTLWADPLMKHSFSLFGNLSFTDLKYSYGMISYLNNTQSFSLGLAAFRLPDALQYWGDKLTVSLKTGTGINIDKALDWFDVPYSNTTVSLGSSAFLWEPFQYGRQSTGLVIPSSRWQNDASFSFTHRFAQPNVANDIHPLRAYGINANVRTGLNAKNKWFGQDQEKYVIGDLRFYDARPIFGSVVLYSYGRAQKQFGKPLPFESVQLAQFDNISVSTINETSVTTWSVPDRVRGYRQFITANQLFFNTEEIRFPLLPSLRTSILGLIYFGKTTIAIFSDVARADDITFPASNKSLVQWGLGGEIKNKLNILGLPLTHALGMAKPHNTVFDNKIKPELYYRIQAVVAF